jgi:hypothetical protein
MVLKPGLDTLLFGIPAIALLVFGYFRLDEVFLRKAGRSQPRGTMQPFIRDESEMACDPDGRPWDKPATRKNRKN